MSSSAIYVIDVPDVDRVRQRVANSSSANEEPGAPEFAGLGDVACSQCRASTTAAHSNHFVALQGRISMCRHHDTHDPTVNADPINQRHGTPSQPHRF